MNLTIIVLYRGDLNMRKIILWIIGSIIIAAVGFTINSLMINKVSNKLYKKTIEKESIDFDNLEPEIVKKHKEH